jgi:peroxiredoxin
MGDEFDRRGSGAALPGRFGLASLLRAVLLVLLAACPCPGGVDGDDPPARKEYQAILAEYGAAIEDAGERYPRAETDEERRAIRDQTPPPEFYYPRLLALAERHPDDSAAVDALIWIVAKGVNGFDAFGERGRMIGRAMDILARDHLGDHRVGRVCLNLVNAPSPLRDEFLPRVYEGGRNDAVRGRACLALAEYLLAKSKLIAYLRGPDGEDARRRLRDYPHRLTYYERFDGLDPRDLTKRAEELLDRVIADHGDLDYDPIDRKGPRMTLADVAREDLFKLRNLAVGQQAPEIEGEDVAGERFRLSDYRGRVVLLSFSGDWCGPCRAMYPDLRRLVERLKDRPFALLSVNTDAKRETLRRSIDAGEVTWRCWWESGTEGPICSSWLVGKFPTTYVLDARGVVRYRDLTVAEDLDRAIDALLQELVELAPGDAGR